MHDLLIYVRAIHFASTLTLTGVVIFTTAVTNPAARRVGGTVPAFIAVTEWNRLLAWSALILSVISGAGWLFLTAAAMSGENLADVVSSGALWTVLTETTFGHAAVVRVCLAAVLAFLFVPLYSTRSESSVRLDVIAAFIAAAFAGGVAWGGHAAGGLGAEAVLHPAADVLHLVAAAAWVGALAPLAILLAISRRAPDELNLARGATLRFSILGMAAVATLLLTGLVNSWYLVGSTDALLHTYYGHLLLFKLGLFLGMVAIATYNWSRLTPALVQTDSVQSAQTARRSLCRSAAVEVAAGAIIIAIVASLGIQPPANHAGHEHSTSGIVPSDAAFQHIHTEEGMADVMIEPGQVGTARATIRLWTDDLDILTAQSLTLKLTAPSGDSKPVTLGAVQQPDAAWIVDGIQLPQSGNWDIEVDAVLASGKRLELRAPILIRDN